MSDKKDRTAEIVTATMLRAMVAVGSADGPMQAAERQTIKDIIKESVGTAPDDRALDDLATSLNEYDGTIRDIITAQVDNIPKEVRGTIVQACFFVVTSSLPVTEAQEQTLARVAEGLLMTQQGFDKAIAAAQDMLEGE